jgi:hypothetical protein
MPLGARYNMLYYPLVHPPKSTLFEAALYWDGLTSLVPTDPSYFSRFGASHDLELLQDEGIYTPTLLDSTISGYQVVVDELEQVLSKFDIRQFSPDDQLNMYTRLWKGKLPLTIEWQLVDRGLLVADAHEPTALRGNSAMLQALLSIAATYAAKQLQNTPGRNIYVPSTTDNFASRCATAPLSQGPTDAAPNWIVDVSRALPIPPPDTPLEHVLASATSSKTRDRPASAQFEICSTS